MIVMKFARARSTILRQSSRVKQFSSRTSGWLRCPMTS